MIVLQWVVVVVLLHVAMDEDMVIVLITSVRTIHAYVVYRLRVRVQSVVEIDLLSVECFNFDTHNYFMLIVWVLYLMFSEPLTGIWFCLLH